jgi:hypothetical protein
VPGCAAGKVIAVSDVATGRCAGHSVVVRRVPWGHAAGSAYIRQTNSFQGNPWCRTPWYLGFTSPYLCKFRVAHLAKDVGICCRDCQTCQRGRVTKQPSALLQDFPVLAKHFSHVHVDLVGPLPPSEEGHVYLLTIIDRTTRWVEVVPLKNMEAATCEEDSSVWRARHCDV